MPTPVSIVASESSFSTGGRVLEVYISSLKPEMEEALICAQNWLRPSFYQFKDLEFNEEYEIFEDVLQGFTKTLVGSKAMPSSQTQSQPYDAEGKEFMERIMKHLHALSYHENIFNRPTLLISLL